MALIVSPLTARQWYVSNHMAFLLYVYLRTCTCGVDGVMWWMSVRVLGLRTKLDTAGPVNGFFLREVVLSSFWGEVVLYF